MAVNFYRLIGEGGKPDAREKFQKLIAQLVRLRHGTARQIEANPGDWGIDVFVGEIDGVISVWQAKFFIDGVDKVQHQQIRDSFKQVVKAADNEGFKLGAWTLCVPVSLSGPSSKWWAGWHKRQQRNHQIQIKLWDETELEHLLISPDADAIRESYFPSMENTTPPELQPILSLPSEIDYEETLFVKQLRAAEIGELNSAKRQFFNADLLSREVTDKGLKSEKSALANALAEVHALWEHRFIEKTEIDGSTDRLPGLYSSVMRSVERLHKTNPGDVLRMSLVHRFGNMHLIVETGEAGWVRSFRSIATSHYKEDQ